MAEVECDWRAQLILGIRIEGGGIVCEAGRDAGRRNGASGDRLPVDVVNGVVKAKLGTLFGRSGGLLVEGTERHSRPGDVLDAREGARLVWHGECCCE